MLQDIDLDADIEVDPLIESDMNTLSDSSLLALMLRLCDCDWLLNADVLSSSDLDIDRECDLLIDGLRDPLFEMDTDCEMDCDLLMDPDASALPLLL